MRFLVCLLIHLLYKVVRPLWFWLTREDAEVAHEHGMAMLRFIGHRQWLVRLLRWLTMVNDPRLHCTVAGVACDNPVWLAAGFCKYADGALVGLSALGFGGIVLGSITHEDSLGNPRPRLFRDGKGNLLNRMRFNNDGAVVTHQRLRQFLPFPIPLVISISKSVSIEPDNIAMVVNDIGLTFTKLYDDADAIEFNPSSPNSQGLRALQKRKCLAGILRSVISLRAKLAHSTGVREQKKICVKVDSDMPDAEFVDTVEVCIEVGVDCLVLTNTTIDRQGLSENWAQEKGGVSGRYLFPKALARVRHAANLAQGRLQIIGVGGISSADDTWQMLRAGADAIQLLTALSYEGPMLPYFIKRGLLRRMQQARVSTITAIKHLASDT